ncbi:MAG: HD domain-containing phosphohydrolase [Halofilum sp. (in: g-proteobacteria)]
MNGQLRRERTRRRVLAFSRKTEYARPRAAAARRSGEGMQELLEHIGRLNAIGVALSAERDTGRLLERILRSAKDLTAADGGTLYLVRDDHHVAFEIMSTDSLGIELGGASREPIPFEPLPLEIDGKPNSSMVVTHCVHTGTTVAIADAYDAAGFDFSGTRAFDERTGYRTQSLLTVPMRDHEGRVIGVLQLINAMHDGRIVPFSDASRQLAESLASQAAIALTNKRLVDDLRGLFDAFVRILAEAIDQKSPYTGAHCRRVPELTMMLADAADRAQEGALRDFRMTPDDRYALELAGWLHDCGKVTTPEHVMDKSTKLETVHDRIEEVAARFATCRARIEAECAVVEAAQPDSEAAAQARRHRDERLAALDEDLAFLRRINAGGETMSRADHERIHEIAAGEWIDAGGACRPILTGDEVENLCVERGTLNAGERSIIEHHVVATIRMLEQLPFPEDLKNVPEYAAGHHERVDGQGYPNGLTREEMSIPARAMAIADVFEALSAADRPYKEAKPLSQCLELMGRMCQDGHIDPDLFEVFIGAGVYREYAARYLAPEQIDDVDVSRIPGYFGVGTSPIAGVSRTGEG